MKDYWLIKRTDQGGGYVAKPGYGASYTKSLRDARKFEMKESAKANACSNERVVSLAQELGVED